MTKKVAILITGRDPEQFFSCSHTSYVRTHAYAARRAGYETHILCLARRARVEETPYGTVHAFATPLPAIRQNLIKLHAPLLARGAGSLIRSLGGGESHPPIVLHGFGLWAAAAVRAQASIQKEGRYIPTLLGSYTTYLDESESQWRGLTPESGAPAYVQFALEQAWIRAAVFRLERDTYRSADRVLVNYRSVQTLVHTRFGGEVRCEVVPYSIEREFLPTPPRPELSAAARSAKEVGIPTIVSIARHDPRKGVDLLLHALAEVKRQGLAFRACLIGGGPLLETHRRLCSGLGLTDRVEIPGHVLSVDAGLHEADLFVLPSREEQSGSLALLEAMRAGLACLASACDGIPEDVQHGQDAFLVKPNDANALAAGLRELLANTPLRARLARQGRATFESRFAGDAFSKSLNNTYDAALADLPNI